MPPDATSESPTFSILMAAYDAGATIDAAIESVLAQTEPSWELLVVDDGSRDDTAARVERHAGDPRVRLLRQENRGLADARNTALAAARGRLVSILDADDLYMPGYLDGMRRALDADPEAGFAYTDAWLLDERSGRIGRRSAMTGQRPPADAPADARTLLRELILRNFVYVAATVRREALAAVGPFNPSLRALEDYELWLRLAAHGYRAVRAPGLLAVYRRRPGSLSANERRMRESEEQVLRMVAARLPEGDQLRALAERRAAAVAAHLAAVTRTNRRGAAVLGGRRALGRLTRPLRHRRLWHAAPPPEVASAFPDLGLGRAGSAD